MKFDTGIPSDSPAGAYITQRFLNFKNGGICYSIIPEVMKGAMPSTAKYISKDTVRTKAGSFNVDKYHIIIADTFISKLIGQMMGDSIMMVENSVRHLVVKSDIPGGRVELDEISNINIR